MQLCRDMAIQRGEDIKQAARAALTRPPAPHGASICVLIGVSASCLNVGDASSAA
jgi:hypothetical protein